jgi:hypothetical protein
MKTSRTISNFLSQFLLVSIFIVFSTAISFADYSVPVEHMHDGRVHSHQLPLQGIAHRHGIGSPGVALPNTTKQTDTVIYTNPPVTVKPPKPDYQSNSPVQIDNSEHVHGGRRHTHPLPSQGIYHRHGSGPLGERVEKVTRQTGTVIYGTPQPPVETSRQRDGFSFDIFRSNKNPRTRTTDDRRHDNYRDGYRKDNRNDNRRRRNLVKGDTNCRPGQADCNVCAVNVQQQFQKAANGQISWRSKPWRFSWPDRYPPDNLSPMDIFNGDPGHALGIPDTHVQGFVRTNSARFPYAGSHSHKRKGGIFVIKQDRDGKKYLSSLHQTPGRHPSGVHIVGKYLMYGLGNRLYFKDINSPNQRYDISLPLPKPSFGGGLGVFKLADGRHLIVTSGPGGQDNRPRFNRFYVLKSINGRPSSIRFINESATKKPAQWPRALSFSENLSLITECDTGDVYAVHTTGDEKGIAAITGNGYWRLSKLVNSNKTLGLTAVNAFTNRQNMKSCNVRAAATVHVNNRHNLEFYCHGYAKDPDGSTFNVLGRTSRNRDKFYFKVGEVR